MYWFFVLGQLQLRNNNERTRARTGITTEAVARGFTATPFPGGDTLAGVQDVTISGKPGIRFCYRTDNVDAANAAVADLGARFDVDEESYWGVSTVPQ